MSEYYVDRGICPGCKEHCEAICADCEGTGEVAVDVDDGEGHTMRGVGSQKCLCRIDDSESDGDGPDD